MGTSNALTTATISVLIFAAIACSGGDQGTPSTISPQNNPDNLNRALAYINRDQYGAITSFNPASAIQSSTGGQHSIGEQYSTRGQYSTGRQYSTRG